MTIKCKNANLTSWTLNQWTCLLQGMSCWDAYVGTVLGYKS